MKLQSIFTNSINKTAINNCRKPAPMFTSSPVDKFERKAPTFDDELKNLSKIQKDGKTRFSDGDLRSFSHIIPDKIKNVKYFADTKLSGFEIKWIVEQNDVDFAKLGEMIATEQSKDKNVSITFNNDSADKSNYVLTSKSQNVQTSKLLDNGLNVLTEEITKDNGDYSYTEVKDYKNNTEIKAKSDKNGVLLEEIKTYKDKNNKIVKIQSTKASQVEGAYDVQVKNADGSIEVLSQGKYDAKTGVSTVTKNMTSYDGTKTQYKTTYDKDGNRETQYQIADKNGKVLMNNKEKFVKKGNKAVSEKNGQVYEIVYGDKNISVKNNGKTTEIGLYGFANGDISPMKKLSGAELVQMKNNVTKYNGSQGSFAAYDMYTKEVNTSDNKLSTLCHELGHAKDYRNKAMEITNDEKFVKTFEKEKQAFVDNSSNYEREMIAYFLRPRCHQEGEKGGLVETVAEVNALINAPADDKETGMRKQVLQQYFPRTIAVLNEKLEKFSDTPLKQSSNPNFGH